MCCWVLRDASLRFLVREDCPVHFTYASHPCQLAGAGGRNFGCGHSFDAGFAPGEGDDFTGYVRSGGAAGIDDVVDSFGARDNQLAQLLNQILDIGGRTLLVSAARDRRALPRQIEGAVDEVNIALGFSSEELAGADDEMVF